LKDKIIKVLLNWDSEWGFIACDKDVDDLKTFTEPMTTVLSDDDYGHLDPNSLPDVEGGYGLPEEFVKPLADQEGKVSATEVVEALGKLFKNEIEALLKKEYKQNRPRATSKTHPHMVKPQRETIELLNDVIQEKRID
jgi:hypothetical protein